jgi:hypothetical protein
MTTALQRLIAVERSQLGTAERPHGSNNVKYNTAYYGHKVHNVGSTNYAWCVVFQWWCFQKAGIPTSVFPKSANVFAVRDWYKKRGRFTKKPRVGSLAIFSFSHIGLVVKVNHDGSVHTIEGNTDVRGGRTGGMVMLKTRSRDIEGYCHPNYAKVAPHPTPPARPAATAAKPAVVKPSIAKPAPGSRPVHTAVQAVAVAVPAGRVTTVQFTSATANTGGFWAAPVGTKRGYNLVTGAGVFIAEVTVESAGLGADAALEFRLVEVDPANHYKTVKAHPPGEVVGPAATTRHTTTLSGIGPGHHLWLQLSCTQPAVLPSVTAEVVLLSP